MRHTEIAVAGRTGRLHGGCDLRGTKNVYVSDCAQVTKCEHVVCEGEGMYTYI